MGGGGETSSRNRRSRREEGDHSEDDQRKLDSPLYGDGFAWSNFRRNYLKKGYHRLQTLTEELNNNKEGMQNDGGGFIYNEEQQRRRAVINDDNFYEDTRKSREASLLDVWKNLIVIRLSRSLNQTQVSQYFVVK